MIKKMFNHINIIMVKKKNSHQVPYGHKTPLAPLNNGKKVSFGHMTHDVMKIVNESNKIDEKEVFDKPKKSKKKSKSKE